MAVITRGIQLYCGVSVENDKFNFAEVPTTDATYGNLIPGLQEIGDIYAGESSAAGREKIEVTTLADDKHVYVDGIMADGSDSESIEFKFLYDPKCYTGLQQVLKHNSETSSLTSWEDSMCPFYLLIPNGEQKSVFKMFPTGSVKLDGAGVNAALTMTLTVTPKEPIEFTQAV